MPLLLPVKLFMMYAHADQDLMRGLKGHLQPLAKRGDIAIWYDGEICPGQVWDKTIKDQINRSDIILLMISVNFLNSEYIDKEELSAAYCRHKEGKAIIVPIIVKPCLWEADIRIGTLQVLPQGSKPISSWEDKDEAWVNVVHGIKKIIEQRNFTFNKPFDSVVPEIYKSQFSEDFYSSGGVEKTNIDVNKKNDFEGPSRSIKSIITETFRQIEDSSSILRGVPSGFFELDRVTGGWHASDLIIIAGESGMGKSSLAFCLTLNAAGDFKKKVAFFSLEASGVQIAQQFISIKSEISISKLQSGNLEDFEWMLVHETVNWFDNIPIFVDDTPGVNIFELGARCRQLKLQHNIDLIVIDCLQLMTINTGEYEGEDSEHKISFILRGLKNLAKEINVPIVVISQVDSKTSTYGRNRMPKISDLSEYRSVENYADVIIFIYRPEYYQILEDENGQSLKGVANLIVAKHRNGALGTACLKFDGLFKKFCNFAEHVHVGVPKINISKMTDKDIPF